MNQREIRSCGFLRALQKKVRDKDVCNSLGIPGNGRTHHRLRRDLRRSRSLDTELLRDANYPRRYVTIDRWVSAEAYNSFQREWQEEYKELDTRCERLMERETFLGTFLSVHSGG